MATSYETHRKKTRPKAYFGSCLESEDKTVELSSTDGMAKKVAPEDNLVRWISLQILQESNIGVS